MRASIKAAARFFILAVSIVNVSWAAKTVMAIAGRSVSVDLVKADDLSPAPWPEGDFELTTQTVTTAANSSIYDLLTADGIEPDVEAFAVVYDLNPSLKVVDPLASGVSLVLPKAHGGDQLQDKLRHGYLVRLTVDRTLREELERSAADLQDLSARFTGLAPERFSNPPAKQAMTAEVKALAGWLAYANKAFLQRTGPPLRRQSLLGMRDEALALNSILASILSGQQIVSADDQKQVDAIYRDIQIEVKKYDNIMAGEPQSNDEERQVIITIHGGDANLIQSLQVYYTWEALYREPPKEPLKSYPFDQVGSGVSASLTLQDFVVWAAKPGHPFPPFTDHKPVAVRSTEDNPRHIDLSLIQ